MLANICDVERRERAKDGHEQKDAEVCLNKRPPTNAHALLSVFPFKTPKYLDPQMLNKSDTHKSEQHLNFWVSLRVQVPPKLKTHDTR